MFNRDLAILSAIIAVVGIRCVKPRYMALALSLLSSHDSMAVNCCMNSAAGLASDMCCLNGQVKRPAVMSRRLYAIYIPHLLASCCSICKEGGWGVFIFGNHLVNVYY